MKSGSIVVLVFAVLGAVGGWMAAAAQWSDLSSPAAIGGLLLILVSVGTAAWKVTIPKLKQ